MSVGLDNRVIVRCAGSVETDVGFLDDVGEARGFARNVGVELVLRRRKQLVAERRVALRDVRVGEDLPGSRRWRSPGKIDAA
jgi:hypothetical protein